MMYFVYSLQSTIKPDLYYVGLTTDLSRRMEEHNSGKSTHTNKFKPWILTACISLPDKTKAEKLERYLKTGSGRASCTRHF